MKKITIFLLAALLVAVFAIPAAAGGGAPIGEHIIIRPGLIDEFPAGAPFYVMHGFMDYLPGTEKCNPAPEFAPSPRGLLEFKLDVDGAYVPVSYVQRKLEPCNGPANHSISFVFNFPQGLPAGQHILTGHWIMACGDALEVGYIAGPCPKQNARVEAMTRSVSIDFVAAGN